MTQEETPLSADPVTPPTSSPTTSDTGLGLVDAVRGGWASVSATEKPMLIGALAATALLALGTLLTWFNAIIISVSGVNTGAGKLTLLIALASAVATAAVLAGRISRIQAWPVLSGTHLGIAVYLLMLLIRFHNAFSPKSSGDTDADRMAGEFARAFTAGMGAGTGIWLCLLAALAAAAAYAVLAEPSLSRFQLPISKKRLGSALGVGAGVGLLAGIVF